LAAIAENDMVSMQKKMEKEKNKIPTFKVSKTHLSNTRAPNKVSVDYVF